MNALSLLCLSLVNDNGCVANAFFLSITQKDDGFGGGFGRMDSGGFGGVGGYGGGGFMASQGMSPSTQMQEEKQVNGTERGVCVLQLFLLLLLP